MSIKAWINGLGASAVLWLLIFWACGAFAADLPLRYSAPPAHRHILQIKPMPPLGTTTTNSQLPLAGSSPELCLEAGHEPYPGQTLQQDVSCVSKLRWVKQK